MDTALLFCYQIRSLEYTYREFSKFQEYWSLVEIGISTEAKKTDLTKGQKKVIKDQKLKDLNAKNYLFQAIDRSILETILKKDTAKDIWDSLKHKY
jgi:hypothetical protein